MDDGNERHPKKQPACEGVLPAGRTGRSAGQRQGCPQESVDLPPERGLGYPVLGKLDHRNVEELIRINGDLGRLGGLLKLWLTNDERTAAFGESTVRGLLAKIEATQDELRTVVRSVVIPRSDR